MQDCVDQGGSGDKGDCETCVVSRHSHSSVVSRLQSLQSILTSPPPPPQDVSASPTAGGRNNMAKTTLGYWDIRGLAQPIRFILAYVGEEHEDVRYKLGPAPDYDKSDWFNVKFKLGLPFPNLPYYVDDKVKLTGTNAIFRYLGAKYNLAGDDPTARATCDLMLEQAMDLRNNFVGLCYGPDFAANKAGYILAARATVKTWEAFLGSRKFFTGATPTVADFHVYEMLDQHQLMDPAIMADCPALRKFCDNFRQLPAIKAYLASDKFKARPVNNLMAGFH